jgi:WD40 repeat protein
MSLSNDLPVSFEAYWNQFLKRFNGEFWCCDITKDSRFLVTGGQDKTVRIWDLLAGSAVSLLTVSSNSKYILSGSLDKTVKLWDFQTSELLHTFKSHENSVFCVSISPDETKGVSGSQDNSLILLNLLEKSIIAKLNLSESVKSVKFLNNFTILSGSFDRSLKVWNLENFESSSIKTQSKVMSVAFIKSQNQFVAGGDDGSIRIHSQDSEIVSSLSGHTGGIRALEVSENDELLVSGSSDRTVRLWCLLSFTQKCIFSGHSAEINGVSLSNKGNFIASVSFDCSVKVWEFQAGLREDLNEVKNPLKSIQLGSCYEDSISVLDLWVAFGSDGNSAVVWDLNQDQEKIRVLGHEKRVTCTAMSLPSTLFTGSLDSFIKLWNLETGTEDFSINIHSSVSCLSLSQANDFLVSGSSDRAVKLWNLKTLTLHQTFEGHTSNISSVDINFDGSLVVSSGMDCCVKVWNTQTAELVFDLGFHKEKVWKVMFTDDQAYLVSASHFEFVSVFDLKKAEQVAKIEKLEEAEEWFLKYPGIKRKFLRYL